MVGSLDSSCQYNRFCPAWAAVISPVQNIIFISPHFFTMLVPFAQQPGQAGVLGRLSLCLWIKHTFSFENSVVCLGKRGGRYTGRGGGEQGEEQEEHAPHDLPIRHLEVTTLGNFCGQFLKFFHLFSDYKNVLLWTVAYAANIGGTGTLTGTGIRTVKLKKLNKEY